MIPQYTQYLQATDAGRIYAVQNGNLYVRAGRPVYAVVGFNPNAAKISVAEARDRPGLLLDPAADVADLRLRRTEMGRLLTWRDGPDPASVVLVSGHAGMGKSQICRTVAKLSHDLQWSVGQVLAGHTKSFVQSGPALAKPPPGEDTLLVVEYAERWDARDLLELISEERSGAGRLRVLLAARDGGSWWRALRRRLAKMAVPADHMKLAALTWQSREMLHGAFADAAAVFASRLGADSSSTPMVELDAQEFTSPLSIMIAALVHVDSQLLRRQVPSDSARYTEYLIAREEDHWAAMVEEGRLSIGTRKMSRAVFAASMTHAVPYAVACEVVVKTGLADTAVAADTVLDDHRLCYPWPDPDQALAPMTPDLLGEDYIGVRTAGVDGICEPDPWCRRAVRRLLKTEDLNRLEPHAQHAFMVLTATARRWPEVARLLNAMVADKADFGQRMSIPALYMFVEVASFENLLRLERLLPQNDDYEPVVVAMLDRTVTGLPASSAEALERIQLLGALSRRVPVHWAPVTATLSDNITEFCRTVPDTLGSHAPLVAAQAKGHLAQAFGLVGDARRAAALAREAVDIHRSLLTGDDPTFPDRLGDLASSLRDESRAHIDLGHTAAGIDSAREACAIWRRLDFMGADFDHTEYGDTLNILAAALLGTGDHRSAAEFAHEALSCFRDVTTGQIAECPEAGRALHLIGTALAEAGLNGPAADSLELAAEVLRGVRADGPSAHTDYDLARCLYNLAKALSGHSRDPACEALHEAIALLMSIRQEGQDSMLAKQAEDLLQSIRGAPDLADLIAQHPSRTSPQGTDSGSFWDWW